MLNNYVLELLPGPIITVTVTKTVSVRTGNVVPRIFDPLCSVVVVAFDPLY